MVDEIEIITTTEAFDPVLYEAAFLIAEDWEELGFRVRVRPMEFATLVNRYIAEQDFDTLMIWWSGRVERLDPQHFLGSYHSGQIDPGGTNPSGYSNPEFDRLFEEQQREFDVERRRELVLKAQEIAIEDQSMTILYYRDEVVAYNNKTFDNFIPMAGEAIYNEWMPHSVQPLTQDKTLTIGIYQEPDTINPLESATVYGWKFLRLIYDKLFRLTPDIEPVPWAAESFEAIDETTIDIVLREGLTFHDGEPLTVEDVKFTFDYYIEQDFAYFRPFYQVIDEIVITGEKSLRFLLKEPFAPFITVTLSQIPILPQHIWSTIDRPQELAPHEIPVIGSGSFMFDRYDRGEYKRILRFDDHFKAHEIEIQAIDYIIYADVEGVFTGLLQGEFDITATRLEPAQIPLAQLEDHISILSVPDFGYYFLDYNLRRPPFNDKAVRHALAHSIDKDTIIDILMDGLAEPGTSVIAPINAYWHNPRVPRFPYNLEGAREILEGAGYWWDNDGFIHYPN